MSTRFAVTQRNERLPDPARSIVVGDLIVDLDGMAFIVKNRRVLLPLKEFQLLVFLAENRDRVLTHRQLITAVWGEEYDEDHSTLKVHILRLRKRMHAAAGKSYIHTVKFVGYVLNGS